MTQLQVAQACEKAYQGLPSIAWPPTQEESAAKRLSPAGSSARGVHAALPVLCAAYAHLLDVLDDAELHEDGFPIPLHQVIRLIRCTKVIIWLAFPPVIFEIWTV